MKPRGMHDIPTAQRLLSHSIPATPSKVATQLARMEQEKTRLEQELDVWVGKQQQTEERLQKVRQRIELLRRALDALPADEERKDSGGQLTAGEERKAKGWREITLEY